MSNPLLQDVSKAAAIWLCRQRQTPEWNAVTAAIERNADIEALIDAACAADNERAARRLGLLPKTTA